ncbi:MAG: Gfo/Idh/MocA family oxidoreductase [Nocardioidaceae bacterium]|nr:Gfo/Idh/MocA family oxidoreductase [Nocardioidaceae bacterium]NUS51317.1 Gfo/Idh/MocA family oxidoreductase [Nocardioidaceae bacterium]
MRDLRVGVIGYGLRSGLVRLAHRPGAGSALAGICDPRAERREQAVANLGAGVVVVETVEDLLGLDLDAVFVLSPDHLHEEHAVAVLEAGAAAYLEKPMAITTAGCDRILATAARTGSKVYVGHNMRHMPVVAEMRRLVVEGAIGSVKAVWCRHFVGHGGDFYFKDWHAERAKSTGLLLQKGAHDIDVIHWLAGGYSRSVSAIGTLAVYGGLPHDGPGGYLPSTGWNAHALTTWPPAAQTGINPAADVEDLSMMLMTLDNGVLASYQQCHFTPDYWRSYTVIGDAGRLECFGNGPGGEIRVWNSRKAGYAEADLVVPIPAAEGGHGGADPSIVDEFLGYVRDGGETLTSVVAAREAVAAGYAGTQSLRSGGRPVAIAPPSSPR